MLKKLIESSNKLKKSQDKKKLRWHISSNASEHAQLIATFISCYISIHKNYSMNKQRKVLDKCQQLDFNFDILVHSMLNSLATCIVPLDIAIHLSFIFLMEGMKSLFRFMYAVIKSNKAFILGLKTK